MRFATWNVNSIRSRLDRVVGWLERADCDVVAIQETKCRDDQFPLLPFEALGYEVAHHGLNQWNGVAVLSRVGLDDIEVGFPGQPEWGEPEPAAEARAIGATCGGCASGASTCRTAGCSATRTWTTSSTGSRAWPTPGGAGWLRTRRRRSRSAATGTSPRRTTTSGTWPSSRDRHTSHRPSAPPSAGVVDAGFADVVRAHTPGPGVYTYWDYKQLAFPKRRGMRIDFALCSPALAARVTGASIEREERKGKGPSDHVPVVVELS